MSEENPLLVWLVVSIGGLLAIVGVFALMTWWAWWLFPAWAWFVVPLGVPQISLWHLIALFIMARSRLPRLDEPAPKPKTASDYWGFALGVTFGPMLTWGILRWLARMVR